MMKNNYKNISGLVGALSFSIAFAACSDSPDGGRPTMSEINLSRAESHICESMSELGVDMFREISNNEQIVSQYPNFVISPVSLATALSMLANTSDNDIRNQICGALGCEDIHALNELNRKLLMFLPNPGRNCNIQIENSVWVKQGYKVSEPFMSTMSNYYFAPVASIDFKQSGAENIINTWATRASHGVLDRVVDHHEINGLEALLANVTYFKGKWKDNLFSDELTKKATFHGQEKDVTVDMMNGTKDKAIVYSADIWTAAVIDYEGDVSIALIRPNDGVSLSEISSSFSIDDFNDIVNCKDNYYLSIYLPRFKSTADISNFNEFFKSMDIDIENFRPNVMLEDYDSELLIKLTHKARLETNEKGTVAAAYSGNIIYTDPFPSSRPISLSFDVPFMYFIYDKTTMAIIMAGQFAQP